MKEFFSLLKQGKFREIFISPTDNGFLQFFRYVFVGGLATVVDWFLSFISESLLSPLSMDKKLIYIIATTVGFAGGLLANYLLCRMFVFSAKQARAKTQLGEFFGHLAVGVIGLAMSYLIVLAGTSLVADNYMLFRMLATVIVFVWNYLARKMIVYK